MVGFAAGLYAIQSGGGAAEDLSAAAAGDARGPHGHVRQRRHLLLLFLPRAGADPDLHHGRAYGAAATGATRR